MKQVGIKQDISFNSGLDQKTILGLGERVSGGNWFSFVKEQSLPDWIQVTQIEICCYNSKKLAERYTAQDQKFF